MRKYDTFAIVDEVYAHIIYKPFTYTYFSELPGMHERTVCVGSLSKTFSITGWRVGYIIGAAHIVGEIKKLHAYLTVSTASPLQEAAVAGLRFDRQYYEELTELYAKKETFSWAVLMISVLLIPFRRVPFTFFLTFPNTGIQVIRFLRGSCLQSGCRCRSGLRIFAEDVQKYIRLHFAVNDETLYNALNRLESMREK